MEIYKIIKAIHEYYEVFRYINRISADYDVVKNSFQVNVYIKEARYANYVADLLMSESNDELEEFKRYVQKTIPRKYKHQLDVIIEQ